MDIRKAYEEKIGEFADFLIKQGFTGEEVWAKYKEIKADISIPIPQRSQHLWAWVSSWIEELEESMTDELNESQTCSSCNGSGEGGWNESRCSSCNGTGVEQ